MLIFESDKQATKWLENKFKMETFTTSADFMHVYTYKKVRLDKEFNG